MAKDKKAKRKLLDAARKHQDALQAGGLSATVLDKYESLLKAIDSQGKEPGAAVQVLVKDIQDEVQEFQAAIKKEFPGNASFHSIFKAQDRVVIEETDEAVDWSLADDPLVYEIVAEARLVAAEQTQHVIGKPARMAHRPP